MHLQLILGNVHPVPRQKLADALEQRSGIQLPPGRGNGLDIPLWLPSQGQEGLCFRRQEDPAAYTGPHHGLDAVAIPADDDPSPALPLVADDERKLAPQVLKEPRRSVDLVQGEDQLAVALAGEAVAVLLGTDGPQAVVVVDFAVDNGVDLAVVAGEGLAAAGSEVVDGKAAVCETDARVVVDPEAGVVWASVVEHGDGRFELLGEGGVCGCGRAVC